MADSDGDGDGLITREDDIWIDITAVPYYGTCF